MSDNEIGLVKMRIVVKSQGSRMVTNTTVWVDKSIVGVLLDREEVKDANSVQFFSAMKEGTFDGWMFES